MVWSRLSKLLLLCILNLCAATALGGGERAQSQQGVGSHAHAQELLTHYASRQKALQESEAAAAMAAHREVARRSELTFVAPAFQDKYGDPMYGAYGPLPFVGSPMYEGPRYAASFDRYQVLPVPDNEHRGYYRQAYSNPTLTARTDVSLGIGASSSYMQHGMMVHPGSMAPSSARVMTNNRW